MLETIPAVACVPIPLARQRTAGAAPKPKPEPWSAGQRAAGLPLLDFDLGARFLELLLDGRRLVLAHAFLHGLGRAIDEVLGFLQAEAGDFAHGLNDVDLVAADVGEHDGEFRLLFP